MVSLKITSPEQDRYETTLRNRSQIAMDESKLAPKLLKQHLQWYRGLFAVAILLLAPFAEAAESHKQSLMLMGSGFEITAIATDKSTAREAVKLAIEEIQRIEKLISEWDSTSQTAAINRYAGIREVKVDRELIELIRRSLSVSRLTNGAFDISFASMAKIWKFDRKEHPLPDSALVKQASELINWQKIQIDTTRKTVFLEEKGMRIGFGAIGKGYAANSAKRKMQQLQGVLGGVVNASGDLTAWGQSIHPNGWSVQLANPDSRNKPIGWIRLNNMSIVTSGDYEHYFTHNGKRYSHIIDPRTGYPVVGIKSVTILCPDAELGDALATSVSVLGIDEGLYLVNKLNGVECLIIDQENKLHRSEHLQINYYGTDQSTIHPK